MDSLTVLIAPSGPCDGVLAALTDLSAAGLVDEFAWISDPSAEPTVPTVALIENGSASDVSLSSLVTDRRISLLRICSLVPAIGDDKRLPVQAELAVTTALASTTGAAHIVRIRAILCGSAGISRTTSDLAVGGWHNVIVSPEDSRGPDFGRVPLSAEPDSVELGRYAGPALAGLVGIWSDMHHTPLDDAPVLPGQVVRLMRSYYRKLEADDVEAALRSEILAQNGSLPLPNDQRTQILYVQDPGLAAHTMADALWRKHHAVLQGPRMPYPSEEVEQIGAWAAIKMFLGFLWASIRNAPAAWYNRIVGEVSGLVAISVQNAVFTQAPAAYEVLVRGRRSDGQRASWAEIGNASDRLTAVLGIPSGTHNAGTDLSALWQDYTGAALTLADAGARTADLPPVQVGAARGVIRRSAEVVPGPGDRFTNLPGVVAAAVESDGVDATNVLGTADLRSSLNDLQRDPMHGLAAGSTLSSLDEWQRKHSRSFGVAVGSQLASAFHARLNEIQQLLEKMRTAQRPPEQPASANLGLARWVQVLTVVWLLITAGFIYLTVKGYVDWWVTVLVVLVALVTIVLGLGFSFISIQRRMFALLHQRRAVIGMQEVDRQNFQSALQDFARLTQAYQQFLSWSRVIGGFLAAPLGPENARHHSSLHIEHGMPMSTAVAVAQPTPADLTSAADHLRRDLFRPGWLTQSWEDLIARAAPVAPAPGNSSMISSPVWSDRGLDSGSPLDRFSTAMYTGTLTSSGADVVWRNAVARLTGPMSTLVDQLLSTVQIVGGPTSSAQEFLAGIDRPTQPSGTFPGTILTDTAVTGAVARVAVDYRQPQRFGLGIICAATQLSEAFHVDNLATTAAVPNSDIEWTVKTPMPTFDSTPSVSESTAVDDEFSAPDPRRGFEF